LPFEAHHYNTSRYGKDLTRFVAPPYDVIDPVLERKLKEDRLNITHITLGDEHDKYCVASRRLKTWLDDKVLVKDSGRSFYIYEQTFAGLDGLPRVRSGIVGLVKTRGVLQGCRTSSREDHTRHKADRMELMEAMKGDVEQVFLLYEDASGEIEDILRTSKIRDEEFRFVDPDGVQHR